MDCEGRRDEITVREEYFLATAKTQKIQNPLTAEGAEKDAEEYKRPAHNLI